MSVPFNSPWVDVVTRPNLHNVTALNIEMLYPDEAIRVMNHCLRTLDLEQAILYMPMGMGYSEKHDDRLIIRQLPQMSYKDVTLFALRLASVCYSDFIMTVQNDGFPIHPENWTPEFLEYDYVASPWRPEHPSKNRVGGGGMTLRSRKLLNFMEARAGLYMNSMPAPHWGDDYWISHVLSDEFDFHGLKRAPLDLACRWGLEYEIPEVIYKDDKSFGFHKFTTPEREEYKKLLV